MAQLQIEQWRQPQQKLINQFYKSHQQNVSCHRADDIYFMRDTESENDTIVAVTFIRKLTTSSEHLHLLRSLFVSPTFRNKGLAKQLIQYILQDQHVPLTVICEPKLTALYLSVGFTLSDASDCSDSDYLTKFIKQNYHILKYNHGSNT
jgi:GNAT superfamily N-acetyltransferase